MEQVIERILVRQAGNYYLYHYPIYKGSLEEPEYKLWFYNGTDKPTIVASFYEYDKALKYMRFYGRKEVL